MYFIPIKKKRIDFEERDVRRSSYNFFLTIVPSLTSDYYFYTIVVEIPRFSNGEKKNVGSANFHPLGRRGWRERWFDYREILETRRVWKHSRPSIIVANRRRWTRDICVFRGTSASTYFAIDRHPFPPHDFYLRENIGELEIATGGGGTRYSNWPSLITWNWWQRGKEKCNTLEYENFLYSMNIKWQSLSWL